MKRRFLTTAAAIVSACLVATILADSAAAQWQQIQSYQQQQRDQRRRQRDAAAQRQIDALTLKLSGVIEALAPGRIQMVTDAGEAWLLQVMSQADVEVTGTATPEFLAPGQFVSFVAQVDTRHSKIDAQVGSLTIFTPDQEHMLGAFPEGPAGAGPGQPGPGGDQPAAAQPPPDARAARAALPDLQTFEIAGRITRLRNGEMLVAIPSARAPRQGPARRTAPDRRPPLRHKRIRLGAKRRQDRNGRHSVPDG